MKDQTDEVEYNHLLHHCCNWKDRRNIHDSFLFLPLVKTIQYNILLIKSYKPFSIRMKCNTVYRSKVTFHSAYFFFKYHMKETSIKFSNPCRCCSYVHCFLATTKNNLFEIKKNLSAQRKLSNVKMFSVLFFTHNVHYFLCTLVPYGHIQKSSQTYMVFKTRQWRWIHRSLSFVCFQMLQTVWIKKLKEKHLSDIRSRFLAKRFHRPQVWVKAMLVMLMDHRSLQGGAEGRRHLNILKNKVSETAFQSISYISAV